MTFSDIHVVYVYFMSMVVQMKTITGILYLKWNTVLVFKILHEGFFTLKICMRIDVAKP